MTLNISLFFCNKFLFNYAFSYPIFLILTGSVATFFGCVAALLCGLAKFQRDELRANFPLLLAFAMIHAVDVGLENVSLMYISISLNQIIKATSVGMTMVLACLFENHVYTRRHVVSVLVTVVGAALAVLRNPEVHGDGVYGVVAACLSSVGAALSVVILAILLQRARLNALSVGAASSFLSLIPLVPAFYVFEYGAMQSATRPVWRGKNADVIVRLVVVETAIAFVYNVVRFLFIESTSSTYSSLAGNFKMVILVLLSFLVFGRTFVALNYVGLVMTVAGFIYYSRLKSWRQRVVAAAVDVNKAKESGIEN